MFKPANTSNAFDEFFNRLIWGEGSIGYEHLLGSDNVNALMSAANNLYERFMICVIDREYRSRIGANRDTTISIPNGGIAKGKVTAIASRLEINKTSKILLQVFLGYNVVLRRVRLVARRHASATEESVSYRE